MPLVHPISRGKNKNSKYINLLSKIAIAVEPVANARIASALVYKNEVVSVGICKHKSHPFQAEYSKNNNSIFLHSETDCIKNALKDISVEVLSKCTLYIVRVKYEDAKRRKFIFGLAKPCEGCTRAIANFNIKEVIYSLDNDGYATL
jgi:deoxycytidylate deaminase